MKDLSKQPGYRFHYVRLLHANYNLDPSLVQLPEKFENKFDYGDSFEMIENKLLIKQTGKISIYTGNSEQKKEILSLEVVIEGLFETTGLENIASDEFGTKNAPVILFPYLREIIFRLTSNMGTISPVLLPPINVIALKESKAAK
ncbi:MAG: protein-export chaperone SecB [Deltaproteobacteria bacterium]|nr:protein-export chaperone SecB [Deltaproteobacteria bacterium]MCL5276730.1 protein-export chaperone SecB [Deltaproteobacteria bacterium]